jgi:alkaline phosphatase D
MSLTRRNLLKAAGALGIAAAVPGCGDDAPAISDGGTPDAGPPPPPTGPFRHGVASGDPLTDSVILWTRVTPEDPATAGDVSVDWELASDAAFAHIVTSGTVTTSAARDFTVKVDATGLAAGNTYFYRFRALAETSAIGRTKTAPAGAVTHLRFAVAACASYAHGYFTSYGELAKRADLDAVLFLGDYIYEYGDAEYGNFRPYDPPTECLTLSDYRRRYAYYRLDANLREAHRQHPWITTWDDHEIANNTWRDGAANHQPTEGSFADRKAAAIQAYSEWLPLREQTNVAKIWRALSYGNLAEIIVLDSRNWGRELQVTGIDDPALNDPARQLLGADQEAWLAERLTTTTAQWKLVAQQVVMSPFSIFFNEDAWDGYPAARTRFLDILETNALDDVLVLTGDIHMSIAGDLARNPTVPADYNPDTGEGSLAVELVAPGISALGLTRGIAMAQESSIRANAPQAKGWNLWERGYYVLDLTPARAQGAWFLIPDVTHPALTEAFGFAVATATGANHLTVESAPAPGADAPALAP